MIISYNWLKEYLPVELGIEKLSEILTSIGLEVEGTEPVEFVKGSLEGLVIGEVLTAEKHPNADKLKLTTVNTGNDEPLHIVCGAPNVAAGQKVVVAPVGSSVHPMDGDAFPIKKAKIRGEVSEGMICAEDEISLGDGHDGIMILPEDAEPGTSAKDYFKIPEPDIAIHIGLTPNRSDAMSHIGVAKDVVAYLNYHDDKDLSVVYPESKLPAKGAAHGVEIDVKDTNACPRYMGLTITDIKVAASPEWLQRRLKAIGIRSINNVVDITNYVLHEWGQPLHAFDADKIEGDKIVVQTLANETEFETLDEEKRKLTSDDLMICDTEKGMCIAGVFGGKGSGVTDSTDKVFIESAYFNPMHIRRTSMHHGLRTDAATHFEKGVSIDNLEPALIRAAQLICEIAGGKVASEITDVYPVKHTLKEVSVKYEYIYRLSGKEYKPAAILRLLSALGFTIKEEDQEGFTVTVPSNKTDVEQPADIVEEILRIDGLDNIPIPERMNISLKKSGESDRLFRNKIAERLTGKGFREVLTNSITNSKYYPDNNNLVTMLNSLSAELDVLRPSMLENILEVVQYNCNRKNTDLMFYEFGKVYAYNETGYQETAQLILLLTGNVNTAYWGGKEEKAGLHHLKGMVDNLTEYSGIDKVKHEFTENGVKLIRKKKDLCVIEEVDTKKLYDFDIKQPVFYAVINWSNWLDSRMGEITYSEIPKYPSVERDLALILDKAVTYGQVKTVTDKVNISSLQRYNLFDIFESEKLGADKKSYALNYVFQLPDRTFTDEETDKMMQQLITAYKKELNATIRE